MNDMQGRDDPGIAALFAAAEGGDAASREALFASLYDELRRLAQRKLAQSGVPVALSPTTLLHEAYLDLEGRQGPAFPDRARFMGYVARVMRGLIIDHARNRSTQKRGGRFEITSLKTDTQESLADAEGLTRLSDALDELAGVDPSLAEIVDLKFFCGFSVAEIAAVRNVSESTVQRSWERARAYLHKHLRAA